MGQAVGYVNVDAHQSKKTVHKMNNCRDQNAVLEVSVALNKNSGRANVPTINADEDIPTDEDMQDNEQLVST